VATSISTNSGKSRDEILRAKRCGEHGKVCYSILQIISRFDEDEFQRIKSLDLSQKEKHANQSAVLIDVAAIGPNTYGANECCLSYGHFYTALCTKEYITLQITKLIHRNVVP